MTNCEKENLTKQLHISSKTQANQHEIPMP